jgi:hypothetical protein
MNNQNNKYELPRAYLSYSAMALWQKDKEAFRRRYYLDEKPIETYATIFGKKVHEQFEQDDSVLGSETRFEVEIDKGLRLLGYIDSFNEADLSIIDFKTSHNQKTWTPVTVAKNKQLVFYSLLVQAQYGKFNRVATLKWYETAFANNPNEYVEYKGRKYYKRQQRDLKLTGRVEVFTRKIYKWEIEKLRKEVCQVAKEISKDYQLFKETI